MTLTRTTIKIPIEYLPTTKTRIPQFLPPLVEFLHNHADSEGIFRINGNKTKVLKLNEMISQHIPQWPEDTTPYDAASFVKLWLKELPVPLIIPVVVSTYFNGDIQHSAKDILFHMPLVTRKCIAAVFGIMKDVLDNEDKNKMGFTNLSTCIFPALTHNLKDLPPNFSLKAFFFQSLTLLNEDHTDFNVTTQENALCLMKPGGRKAKTCMTQMQRKKIGRASIIQEEDILKT